MYTEAEERALAAAAGARAAGAAQQLVVGGTLDMPLSAQWMEPQMHLDRAISHARQWLGKHGIADPGDALARVMALELAKGRTEYDALVAVNRLGVHARHLQREGDASSSLWPSFERNTQRMVGNYVASSAVSHHHPASSSYSVADHYRVPHDERGAAWHVADAELRRTPLRSDLDRAHPRLYY